MSVLSSVEHAREAYIRAFCADSQTNTESTRGGDRDGTGWIRGYAAALDDLAHARGEAA